ncbi:unnamed protein product [Diatraea saccharalis]|uniref:ACAD9/ACADV-like C-terminal domain-containing protein n=1 Tax=Diatraea saccharalis TaxID=40085 RepID=A0A9N9R4D1_9NEOP|nr:unnamed protein product [Diatraea saccharalis]
MNFVRKICTIRSQTPSTNFSRKFRISTKNFESSQATQPQVQDDKFDFEDLKVLERQERRKPQIKPFIKDVFISVFNKELLAYPEILNKEESECLAARVSALEKVFYDKSKTKEERKMALNKTKMYAAPVSLTNNGLAMNHTESLQYLEVIANDVSLGQEISDHWVGLEAVRKGLEAEQYQQIIDDLTSGDRPLKLCIKEKISERITQADFRTYAELDNQGIWRVTGEKVANSDSINGYLLVLCCLEGDRMKAFLIHPDASGVEHNGVFVNFKQAPATPLSEISEEELARTLAISRLHAATLCRTALTRAVQSCVSYIRPRVFSGKPLSELCTIRSIIGDAFMDIYASESTDYFTTGLLDGYECPDAEMEVAMCRNFMVDHGISNMLKLLAIPSLEQEEECKQLLDDIRHLAARGENLGSINMFIALNGVQHAGQNMASEIKQMRNPLYHPLFIFKKVMQNRHQEKDDPKLNLFLAEHLHPSLRPPSEQLEYCVLRMRYACETLLGRHGADVASAFNELNRLAIAGTEILAMTAVLARASRSYCIGLRNAELEMKLAACFVETSKDKVRRLIKEIDDGEYLNLDHFRVQFGRKMLDANERLTEKPIAKSFW